MSNKTHIQKRNQEHIQERKQEYNEKQSYRIMEAFFKGNSIVAHQLDSFNHFINFGLPDIINKEPPIIADTNTIKFSNIFVDKPQVVDENRNLKKIFPMDARLNNITYDSAVYCDVNETCIEGDEKKSITHNRVLLARIPIMVKSHICNLTNEDYVKKGECMNDPGGYFIVKGHERVLVCQLRGNYNKVFVFKKKEGDKWSYLAEVRSMSESTSHSILLQACIDGNNDINFLLPPSYIKEPIQAGIIFKALGFSEEEIITLIDVGDNNYIKRLLRHSSFIKDKKEALLYIERNIQNKEGKPIVKDKDKEGKDAKDTHVKDTHVKDKQGMYAQQIIENEILPHLGISCTPLEQGYFLGQMIKKLILTASGLRNEDDKDNYTNKRVEPAGVLMHDIFRNLFKKYILTLKTQYATYKKKPNLESLLSKNNKIITKAIHQCIATGNWGVQKNTYIRTGVSQILDRMTYYSSLSHLRRVIIPVGKEGKNIEMRKIHQSSIFFICPCETPEGGKVGVVLNLAMTTAITKKNDTIVLKETISKYINPVNSVNSDTRVYVNNGLVGFVKDYKKLIDKLRLLRSKNVINKQVSIYYDITDKDVKIFCDEGRFIRPLIKLKNGKIDEKLYKILNDKELSWETLLKEDIIRYLDCGEIENSVIAMNYERLQRQYCDYLEIHPCLMLGIMAGKIPFPDHSQSPRNCYSSSMMKQALGIPLLSYNLRTDNMLHVLWYPQRAIVSTKISELTGFHKMPSGMVAIIAIYSGGYNQEDSIIINGSSVDRGLFYLTSYHTLECFEKKRDTYSCEKICLPPLDNKNFKKKNNYNYSLLDENGIVMTRYKTGGSVFVKKGDVLVGKILTTESKNNEKKIEDASLVVQKGEEGYVDKIHVITTPSGSKLVKVVIRVVRRPSLGDKLSSTTGQKATVGMVYRQEDMPFTASGIVPDAVINSCCIPSRMTTNQLIECALGKEALISGNYGDSTPFTENSVNVSDKLVDKMTKQLKDYGFLSPYGWETMYSGITGEQLKARIFIGPTYYQRLKHMVDDKMHARARGSMTCLTRQPLEGRSVDGGLRYGDMESTNTVAHGTSTVLNERLFTLSDMFSIPICEECGTKTNTMRECQKCKSDKISRCNMPYASNLAFNLTTAMGIKTEFKPTK